MSIQGVIFDVGGTIVLSPDRQLFTHASVAAAADFLKARRLLSARQGFTSTLLHCYEELPKGGADDRQINSTRDILSGVCRELGVDLSSETLVQLEFAFNRPYVLAAEPLPGIRDAILALRGRYHLAVASNTRSHRLIEGIVRRFGLRDEFDPFITSESCGWRKPSPNIFLAVLERWQMTPPEVVMVGDSLRKDVVSAQAVGMKGVLLRAKPLEFHYRTDDAVATHAAELPGIIEALG